MFLLSAALTYTALNTWAAPSPAAAASDEVAVVQSWTDAEGIERIPAIAQAAADMEVAGQLEEADTLYAEAVSTSTALFGADHPVTRYHRERQEAFQRRAPNYL